jgi:hypothetical protein
MKMMQGWILEARVKTAPAIFWDSPYHLSVSTLTSRFINRAPASLPITFDHIKGIVSRDEYFF